MNIARQKIDMFLEDILIFKRKCSELLQLNRTMKKGQIGAKLRKVEDRNDCLL